MYQFQLLNSLSFIKSSWHIVNLFYCQPELVEGGTTLKKGFIGQTRLRQAQADSFYNYTN
jgi:hypothetical protein